MRQPVDFERLAESIVDPGRLPPRLRDDICYGCHMQPTVALAGVRHFGRADYSFRPGEPLPDYLVLVDVDEEGRERSERFEINHHPYRLEQSRCFTESDGALSCLSCHDPHRKVPAAERAAHYRAACLGCHELDDCRLEEMTMATGDAVRPPADPGDCAGCHMARRRPTDVVRVVMTDHLIRRVPGGDELVAPLPETEPVLIGVEIMDPQRSPGGDLAEVYRAAAVVRAGGGSTAVERLEQMLARAPTSELDPYIDLARGQLKQRWALSAARTLAGILERDPDHPVAREWLAIARSDLGRVEDAITLLRQSLELGSQRVETHFNLARLLSGHGRPAESLAHFQRAIDARPNMESAHFHLGRAYAKLGRPGDAAASFQRALEIDPRHGDAYLSLAWAQEEQGNRDAALATLRHGAEAADQQEPIRAALERLSAAALPDEPASAPAESSE
jgi:Tfp pilus assembly protein PilF